LIVRPDDFNDDNFVLVITKAPTMIVVGSINARKAKADEFWFRDCWWVPAARLDDLPTASVFQRAAE
jgi:hypothetical protein